MTQKLLYIRTFAGIFSLFFFLIVLIQILIFKRIYIFTGLWLQLSLFFGLLFILLKIKWFYKSNILLFFVSLSGTIIFLEVLLRLFQIQMTYNEKRSGFYFFEAYHEYFMRKPNITEFHQTPEYSFKRKTNSLGFSDIEPKNEKEDNDFLIIALGDSFTEGDGADADSTWPKFLERKIGVCDYFNYNYLNAGFCGSDPIYQIKILEDILLSLNPDLLIVSYGYSDLYDVIKRGGFERFHKSGLIIKYPLELFYVTSYVFRIILHNLFRYDYSLLSKSNFEKEKHKALGILKESMLRFNDIAEKNNFDILFVFYPVKHEIYSEQYENFEGLITTAKNLQLNYLDLLDFYLNQQNIDKTEVYSYYWERDGHHNSKGYKAYANGVYSRLVERNMLPCK